MIINNTHVQGIFLYSNDARFERGDFVVDGNEIYVCTAYFPNNSDFTVSGKLPRNDKKNFIPYPGDKIVTAKEYYNYVNGIKVWKIAPTEDDVKTALGLDIVLPIDTLDSDTQLPNPNTSQEGSVYRVKDLNNTYSYRYIDWTEDKYVSSHVLSEILQGLYFGVGEGGIITDYVTYNGSEVGYSVSGAELHVTNKEILNAIIRDKALNNGMLTVSRSLPELKSLAISTTTTEKTVLLKQHTYIDGDSGNGTRYRVQELVDPVDGRVYYRYSRGIYCEGDWNYDVVSKWKSSFETTKVLDEINAIKNYYKDKLVDLESTKRMLVDNFCYREVPANKLGVNKITLDAGSDIKMKKSWITTNDAETELLNVCGVTKIEDILSYFNNENELFNTVHPTFFSIRTVVRVGSRFYYSIPNTSGWNKVNSIEELCTRTNSESLFDFFTLLPNPIETPNFPINIIYKVGKPESFKYEYLKAGDIAVGPCIICDKNSFNSINIEGGYIFSSEISRECEYDTDLIYKNYEDYIPNYSITELLKKIVINSDLNNKIELSDSEHSIFVPLIFRIYDDEYISMTNNGTELKFKGVSNYNIDEFINIIKENPISEEIARKIGLIEKKDPEETVKYGESDITAFSLLQNIESYRSNIRSLLFEGYYYIKTSKKDTYFIRLDFTEKGKKSEWLYIEKEKDDIFQFKEFFSKYNPARSGAINFSDLLGTELNSLLVPTVSFDETKSSLVFSDGTSINQFINTVNPNLLINIKIKDVEGIEPTDIKSNLIYSTSMMSVVKNKITWNYLDHSIIGSYIAQISKIDIVNFSKLLNISDDGIKVFSMGIIYPDAPHPSGYNLLIADNINGLVYVQNKEGVEVSDLVEFRPVTVNTSDIIENLKTLLKSRNHGSSGVETLEDLVKYYTTNKTDDINIGEVKTGFTIINKPSGSNSSLIIDPTFITGEGYTFTKKDITTSELTDNIILTYIDRYNTYNNIESVAPTRTGYYPLTIFRYIIDSANNIYTYGFFGGENDIKTEASTGDDYYLDVDGKEIKNIEIKSTLDRFKKDRSLSDFNYAFSEVTLEQLRNIAPNIPIRTICKIEGTNTYTFNGNYWNKLVPQLPVGAKLSGVVSSKDELPDAFGLSNCYYSLVSDNTQGFYGVIENNDWYLENGRGISYERLLALLNITSLDLGLSLLPSFESLSNKVNVNYPVNLVCKIGDSSNYFMTTNITEADFSNHCILTISCLLKWSENNIFKSTTVTIDVNDTYNYWISDTEFLTCTKLSNKKVEIKLISTDGNKNDSTGVLKTTEGSIKSIFYRYKI